MATAAVHKPGDPHMTSSAAAKTHQMAVTRNYNTQPRLSKKNLLKYKPKKTKLFF